MISRGARGKFAEILSTRTLLFDGAYGTSFFEMGFGGVPGELLNIEHPDVVEKLHRAYIDAGADIILTNTFGGNRPKLEENSLDGRIREINFSAVEAARRAACGADKEVFVFGDMSSTGRLPRPSGGGTFEECRAAYAEQAKLLIDAGCDGIIVETITDIKEMKAALVAVREVSADVPLIAQMAFDSMGSTLTGASVEVFAAVAGDLDVDVIGMNCLIGPLDMLANLRRMARVSGAFISAEPNAGDPHFDGSKTLYLTSPTEFSLYAEEMVEAGVSIIGGCCGTTPEHISALAAVLRGVPPAGLCPRNIGDSRVVTSRTRVFDMFGMPNVPDELNNLNEKSSFGVIGERINPTGRKQLRESMRAGDWSVMLDEAAAQSREGARILDINFGVEKFFDAEKIADAFAALDRAADTPLSIDIQSLDLMEAALAEYPGRPLINSSACDEESLSKKLPLLRKYGGIMILLAMDSDIPETADGRIAAVERALEKAAGMGLPPERFIIDPLVLSKGAGNDHRVTLDTIRLATARGLATTVGLSNLSHGVPNRSGINAAFLPLAVEAGLSSAIMNPGDDVVMQTLYGATYLKTGMLEDDMSGIELPPLVEALLSGRAKLVDSLVDEKLGEGLSPIEVSQDYLGGAMEYVGVLYEDRKIFLPHIIFAAETAFPVFDRLNGMMEGSAASRGRVLIATVEGDIHDIGKNIVGTVLRAGGFDVVDIGKNVPSSEIVARTAELAPDIVGLSAMMTTTVGRVAEARNALREAGLDVPVISGGASMNSELADMFGVGYSSDSSGVLSLCREIVSKR